MLDSRLMMILVGVLQSVIVVLLALIAQQFREMKITIKDILSQLRQMNGRLHEAEVRVEEHARADLQRFEQVERRVDRLEDRSR